MIRHPAPDLCWKPSLLQRFRKSFILVARRLGLPLALLLAATSLLAQNTTRRLDVATDTYVAGNFATLVGGVGNAAGANLCNADGRFCTFTFDVTGALRVSASFSPPALQNVNLTQVGSVAISGADVVDAPNTAFRVNCVVGCVAGGSFADATAFTFGATTVSNTAFVVDDVATNTVAENSAGAGRMSTNRIPYFSLHTDAGVAVPFPAALGANGGLKIEGVASGTVVPISAASLPLPTGASTLAEQQTQTTALQIIDNLPLAQGAATAGQSGILAQGAVTTAQPTYTTAQTSPLSLSTRGGLRTEGAWPTCPADSTAIDAGSSIRCKVWNSAGCAANGQVGDCEEYKGLLRLKGRRKSDLGTEIVISKVITDDNDRAAAGAASGGASWPFGSAAGRQTSVADATTPGAACNITSITTGELVTSCAHGFATGAQMVLNITGSDALPATVNGLHQVTILSGTTYSLDDIDITGAGTAVGSHFGSRTVTSASAPFVVPTSTSSGSLGKNITISAGGVVCTTADQPCQGPKFPIGTLYQGTIIAVASTTSVTVLPTLHAAFSGATLKIEPILLGDDDATEVGDFCLKGVDLNYWDSEANSITGTHAGIKVGQTYYECEINKNVGSPTATYNMHDGWTLFSDYQETSYHLSWTSGSTVVKRHKVGDTHGWTHQVLIAHPADGAEWTYTVPTNAHVRVLAVKANFTAVGGTATRYPDIVVDDGTTANPSWVVYGSAGIATGETVIHQLGLGITPRTHSLNGSATASTAYSELPTPLELTEGWRLRSSTAGIQGGDRWGTTAGQTGQIIVTLEEWIEE